MVIGLKYCTVADETQDRSTAHRQAGDFMKCFRCRHGSVGCSELLGFDMSVPEGLAEARAAGVFRTRCPAFVRTAAELLEGML